MATIGGASDPADTLFAQLASRGPQQPHQVRLFFSLASMEEARDDDDEEGSVGSGAGAAVATVRLCGIVRGRAFARSLENNTFFTLTLPFSIQTPHLLHNSI